MFLIGGKKTFQSFYVRTKGKVTTHIPVLCVMQPFSVTDRTSEDGNIMLFRKVGIQLEYRS